MTGMIEYVDRQRLDSGFRVTASHAAARRPVPSARLTHCIARQPPRLPLVPSPPHQRFHHVAFVCLCSAYSGRTQQPISISSDMLLCSRQPV